MTTNPLWAPWRMEYLNHGSPKEGECIFCEYLSPKDDKKNLVVYREPNVYLILNRYPYNSGHLLVVPHEHVSSIEQLSPPSLTSLMGVTQKSVQALRDVYKADGFNVGMNIGRAGGAGIADHIHLHVVPRWMGDTNFMPVLAEIKSLPEHLLATWDRISDYFRRRI